MEIAMPKGPRRRPNYNPRSRVVLIASVFVLLFGVVFARSAMLAFGYNSDRASLFIMNREARSLRQLTDHAEDLRRMAKNIDSVSLGDIRAKTERTVRLVDRANLEISAQVLEWEKTRGKIREDEHAYTTLRAQIAQTEKLQAREIVRLQGALEQATSTRQRLVEGIFSLLVGILASVLAALLFPARSLRGLRRLMRVARPS